MTTERELLDLLHYRYSQGNPGNGPRYVVAEHVRSSAGFHARRCLDAMVQDLWPSSGLALHGFELKCSRSDWLRELADPSKADAFLRYVNHFWLVVAHRSMVKLDEVPLTWGVLAPAANGPPLRIVRAAPPRIPEPLPVSLRAALLRATAKTAASRAQVDWLTAERDSARSALTEPAPPKLCAHESVTDFGPIGGLLVARCDDCWLTWPYGTPVPVPSVVTDVLCDQLLPEDQ